MTLSAFTQAYLDLEAAANKTPQGADHKRILEGLAQAHDISYNEAREIVLRETSLLGAG